MVEKTVLGTIFVHNIIVLYIKYLQYIDTYNT